MGPLPIKQHNCGQMQGQYKGSCVAHNAHNTIIVHAL